MTINMVDVASMAIATGQQVLLEYETKWQLEVLTVALSNMSSWRNKLAKIRCLPMHESVTEQFKVLKKGERLDKHIFVRS